MLFLFDKFENLSGIVPKEQVKAAYQTQNLNAAYTLTSTVNQSTDITSALYVGHKDVLNEKSIHLYRIVGTEWADKGITIDGIESAYDDLLADGFIKDQRPTNKSVSEVLTNILAGSRWSVGIVDTSRTVTANFYYISRLEALRKMVESADCEIRPRITFDGNKITGRYIDVVDRLGEDRGKRFVHGSNLLQVIKTDNSAELYTALVGRGKGLPVIDEDGEETGGYGRKIGFADIAWSVANGDPVDKPLGQEWVEIPELTAAFGYPDGRPRIGHADFPEEEDAENLLKRTHDMALFTGRPKVSYRTAVRDIGDTGTGDTVTIIRDDLGIRYKTRIYKRVINLMHTADVVIELGDSAVNYTTKRLTEIENQLQSEQISSGTNAMALVSYIKKEMADAYWGEDGYNYDLAVGNDYGLPAGVYSFDRPIDENPTKFVYFGAGKIVISNEKNPDGTWKLNTILDGTGLGTGLVGADQLIAGAVTTDKINAGAVTVQKIGDGAVSAVKIEDGAVTANKIQAQSITANKFYGYMIESFDGNTYFDLSKPEIVQYGSVGGQTIKVTMSPTKPFQVDVDGEKMVYFSPNTGMLVTEGKWDVNEDGVADYMDYAIIGDMAMGNASNYPAWVRARADLNNTGTVNSSDYVAMANYLKSKGRAGANFKPPFAVGLDGIGVGTYPTTGRALDVVGDIWVNGVKLDVSSSNEFDQGQLSSSNLNNITTEGAYQLTTSYSYTNAPSGITSGVLTVFTAGSGVVQLLAYPSGAQIRYRTSQSWGSWRQITP